MFLACMNVSSPKSNLSKQKADVNSAMKKITVLHSVFKAKPFTTQIPLTEDSSGRTLQSHKYK